jgi:hypothetical protein
VEQSVAIAYILKNGWRRWNPNIPVEQDYFWDGVDKTQGYAWLAAYEEIQRRKKMQIQPSLFEVRNTPPLPSPKSAILGRGYGENERGD